MKKIANGGNLKSKIFKQLTFKEMQSNIDLNFYDIIMKGNVNNPWTAFWLHILCKNIFTTLEEIPVNA